jgi:hypothetical protein
MSTIKPFGSNTLPTFVYEPFSYTISNPLPGTYTLTTSNVTSGIPPGYIVNNGSNVVFSTSSNGLGVGTEIFTITAKDPSGITIATSSNTVTIGAGRFLSAAAPGGSSYVGSNFTFYKNEPNSPIPLVAPFAISVPTSVPSLPPGLTFTSNASNSYSITGTPLVTVPQSNYLFIGKATGSNLGKIVTSQFGLSSSNERVLLTLSGSPIVSPMTVGTAISPRVLTARFPPYPSGGTLRYSWPGLPDGLVVTNSAGVVQPPTVFTPSDASSTLIISGTPTITAANTFRDDNISSTTLTFTGTRTSPLPQISNSQAITFGFGETVLFDTTNVPTLYTGVALDPSATSFRAQTYFGTGSAISTIFSPDLRSDLSLSFVGGGRAYLTGTPGASTGTASYTIRAINSNAISRDLSVPITVAADSVSFVSPPTPAVDICYNFILSRPLSLALSGYYPSNIQFQAAAASGKPVTFSAPALSGTGLSFSDPSANLVQLIGTAETVTPLTTVTVTASAVGTPATASRTFNLAVLNDVITISDVSASSLAFVQNRAITPIQLSATTLSERPVISFTSTDLPAGLSLSTTGLLTGTPTGYTVTPPETFTVAASTGYASQTKTFTYNTVEDNLLIVLPTTTATVSPAFSGVEFDILTYSGAVGNLTTGFGSLEIQPAQSTTATLTLTPPDMLSGTFANVPVLAPEYRFRIAGQAGSYTTITQVNASTTNAPTIQHSALVADSIVYPQPTITDPPLPVVSGRIVTSTDTPVTFPNATTTELLATGPSNWTSRYTFSNVEGPGYDLARNSNVFVAVLGSNILRSVDYGITWSQIDQSNITQVSNVFGLQYSGFSYIFPPTVLPRLRLANPTFGAIATDGGSNWWAIGTGTVGAAAAAWTWVSVLRRSTDNGLTWTDISLAGTTVSPYMLETSKVSYNQGRLFYTGRQIQVAGGVTTESNAFYYADVSDITTWTKPLTTLGDQGAITGIAFSNSTVFAVGDDNAATATFVSTDNGTTWSTGTNPNSGSASGYENIDVFQKYGYWFLGGIATGFGALYSSSNLTDWTPHGGAVGAYSATTENGITWISGGSNTSFQATRWTSNGLLETAESVSNTLAAAELKRLYSDTTVTPSNPTLTFSIPYDASGIGFTSPLQTQYTNWQFVPIPTIDVVATNPVPGKFMYYYASGLPRGLQINLDASGIESSITGTSSQYNDAFQRVVLYAALNPGAGGGGVAAFPITMRTILPTVQKQQTSAGSWTSLVRQYTVVNAAQNSLNGKTLPSTEPPLGEFTRPEPPDAVNVLPCPKC